MMKVLLEETISEMNKINKSENDVKCCSVIKDGSHKYTFSFSDYKKVAGYVVYDEKNIIVNMNLIIEFKDGSWLERMCENHIHGWYHVVPPTNYEEESIDLNMIKSIITYQEDNSWLL